MCTAEYEAIRRRTDDQPHVIRDYAGKNPAEFFAVVTELFFLTPHALSDHHAALYEVLRDYYRQDPVSLAPPG